MKKLFALLGLLSALVAFTFTDHNHELCQGFLPENDLYISEFQLTAGGLDQDEFDDVLDLVQDVYGPEIAADGDTLVINRRWSDGVVNASAIRRGTQVIINMYGGLARHPEVTRDGFTLVACHELGHHLAGAPKISSTWQPSSWASNEGQSDYYATLKCFRKLFDAADNTEWFAKNDVDSTVEFECDLQWQDRDDQVACYRGAMAALSVGKMFQKLLGDRNPPEYYTPDTIQVSSTDDRHPDTQCRLDSYYQGALCTQDVGVELSDSDYSEGTCTRADGHVRGVRPLCWFKPPVAKDKEEEPRKPWWKRWWPFQDQIVINAEFNPQVEDGPYW